MTQAKWRREGWASYGDKFTWEALMRQPLNQQVARRLSTPATAEEGREFQAMVERAQHEQRGMDTPLFKRVVKHLRAHGLEVAVRFEANEALTRCPNHDGEGPFLDVAVDGNKVALHCRQGCTVEQINSKLQNMANRKDPSMARPRKLDFSKVDEPKARPHLRVVPDDGPLEAPLILPDDFWNDRPLLNRIRTYAHSRSVSADAVFYATLARLSAALPPECRLETGIGSPLGASLNTFVALLGESGGGKSTSMSVAAHMVNVPPGLIDDLPIGTGEGLVEAYMGTIETDEGKSVRAQTGHNAFFFMDEGQGLSKLGERSGSTIGAMLRSGWYGATIGTQNASAEKRRRIEEGTYCMGLVIGFQPDTVQPLMAEEPLGTPQRFLYCWTIDPNRPRRPKAQTFNPLPLPRAERLSLDRAVAEEMANHHHDQETGAIRVHRLDAHGHLTRAKVAALLALLESRHTVNEKDWRLAGTVWDTSCRVRDEMILQSREHAKRGRETINKQRAEAAVTSARALRADQEEHELARLEQHARRLALTVHTREAESWSKSDLRRTLKREFRPGFEEALDQAVDRDWLSVDDSGKVSAGASKPAS